MQKRQGQSFHIPSDGRAPDPPVDTFRTLFLTCTRSLQLHRHEGKKLHGQTRRADHHHHDVLYIVFEAPLQELSKGRQKNYKTEIACSRSAKYCIQRVKRLSHSKYVVVFTMSNYSHGWQIASYYVLILDNVVFSRKNRGVFWGVRDYLKTLWGSFGRCFVRISGGKLFNE